MVELPVSLAKKLNKFQEEYPVELNEYYLKRIKYAIKNNLRDARFYKIKGTPIVAGVPASGFVDILEEIQEAMIEEEAYELAEECRKLLEEITIDKLIKESQR